MNKMCYRVLLTYWQKTFQSLELRNFITISLGILLLVLIVPVANPYKEWFHGVLIFGLILYSSFIAEVISSQLDEQYSSLFSRMLPFFDRPHIGIAAVLALSSLLIIGCIFYLETNFSILGTIALVLAAFSWRLFISYSLTFFLLVLTCLLGRKRLPELWEFFSTTIQNIVTGNEPILSLVIIGISLILIAIFFNRVARQREEMIEEEFLDETVTQDSNISRILSKLRLSTDYKLDYLQRPLGFWSRVRHLKLAIYSSYSPWFVMFIMGLILSILQLFGLASLAIFLPGVLIPMFSSLRSSDKSLLGYEVLRPIKRSQFIREFGVALGVLFAEWWFSFCIVYAFFLFVSGNSFHRLETPFLIGSAILVGMPGFIAWIVYMQYWVLKTWQKVLFVVFVIPGLVLLPIGIGIFFGYHRPDPMILFFGVLILSLIIDWTAYRKWCNADLA